MDKSEFYFYAIKSDNLKVKSTHFISEKQLDVIEVIDIQRGRIFLGKCIQNP